MIDALVVAVLLICAAQAVRSTRLLTASIWLGAASAVLSLWLYQMGAHEIAVIELSVGAGLVTVLLVFVIGITGQETGEGRALLPAPVSWALVIGSLLLLASLILPLPGTFVPFVPSDLTVLWQDRGLDVLLQIVLIFAGVLGILSLLGGAQTSAILSGRAQALEPIAAPPSPGVPPPVEAILPPSADESPEGVPHAPPEGVRV